MSHSAGVAWLKIAVVYFVIGVGLGIVMGVSGNHTQFPAHAHINLLGWVSLALIGLIYRQFPDIANNKLAKIQFWLHNLALPVTMLALIGLLRGNAALDPVAGVGSLVIGVSVLLFAVNVLQISAR
ncbi:MAG: cytochrome-c oxidase [Nitrospiraceae bacterium]